ncbi:MAG TPA: hypothetical protein VNN62_10540 [Methylomirabilota bacterium]|jgi:hypothetical protein|nr:hypothetical protein [Methylomirabilota bacterium]
MKATAIALLLLSAYWIGQGVIAFKHQETTTAIKLIVMGIVLLPIAKYLWGKELGPKP